MTATVVPVPWKAMPPWQKAPDGFGEYLPFPDPSAGTLDAGGKRHAATSFGVLAPDGNGWRIVPEMYLRHLIPFASREGLLWAVEGAPPRDPNRLSVPIVALDPNGWKVHRRVALPLGVAPVAVEDGRVWCLAGERRLSPGRLQRPMPPCHVSLIRYGLDGNELFRMDLQKPPASQFMPAASRPWETPNPLISWCGFDDDAVWLAIVDYRGVAINDAVVSGPSRLERVDRATGKRTSVEAPIWPGTLLANTPSRVIWLQQAIRRDGNLFQEVHQLDKKTMRISHAGTLPVINPRLLVAEGNCLWVCAEQTHAFSLEEFAPIPPERTGRPPAGGPMRFPLEGAQSPMILGGDPDRVWIALGSDIVELRDDGTAASRSVAPWLRNGLFVWPPTAEPGVLFTGLGPHLARIAADSNDMRILIGPENLYYYHRIAEGSSTVWTFMGARVRVLRPDFSPVRELDLVPGSYEAALWRDTCFLFHGNPPVLKRCDPNSGQWSEVASWKKRAQEWFRDKYRRDPSPNDLHVLAYPAWMMADGNRGIAILCVDPGSPVTDSLERGLTLWEYDPATDRWTQEDIPKERTAMAWNPGLLYDRRTHTVLRFSDGRWSALGQLPKGWFDYSLDFNNWRWRIHATRKHLYAWTPLGLWRAPLGPKPPA